MDLQARSLAAVRGSRPGTSVQLAEDEIRGLCLKCRGIFLEQRVLLELEAPLKICGELYTQTLLVFKIYSESTPGV